jgi:hypothetical protein
MFYARKIKENGGNVNQLMKRDIFFLKSRRVSLLDFIHEKINLVSKFRWREGKG